MAERSVNAGQKPYGMRWNVDGAKVVPHDVRKLIIPPFRARPRHRQYLIPTPRNASSGFFVSPVQSACAILSIHQAADEIPPRAPSPPPFSPPGDLVRTYSRSSAWCSCFPIWAHALQENGKGGRFSGPAPASGEGESNLSTSTWRFCSLILCSSVSAQ